MSQSVYNSDFRDPKKVKQMMKEKEEREEKENSGKNWGYEDSSVGIVKNKTKDFTSGFARKAGKYDVLDTRKCGFSCTNIMDRTQNNNDETEFKSKPATSWRSDKNLVEMTKSTEDSQRVTRDDFIVVNI